LTIVGPDSQRKGWSDLKEEGEEEATTKREGNPLCNFLKKRISRGALGRNCNWGGGDIPSCQRAKVRGSLLKATQKACISLRKKRRERFVRVGGSLHRSYSKRGVILWEICCVTFCTW